MITKPARLAALLAIAGATAFAKSQPMATDPPTQAVLARGTTCSDSVALRADRSQIRATTVYARSGGHRKPHRDANSDTKKS
jgi:hypothetical protein